MESDANEDESYNPAWPGESWPADPDPDVRVHNDTGGGGAGPEELTLTWVDVGQGDAIVLQTSSGHAVIDTANRFQSSYQPLLDFVAAEGITDVYSLVITHPDADHSGGCNELLDQVAVLNIYHPGIDTGSQTWADCKQSIPAEGAQVSTDSDVDPNDTIQLVPGLKARVLHVDATSTSAPNEGGIVLRTDFGQFSAILGGDISCGTEDDIIARGYSMGVALIHVNHHGSAGSTCEPWLVATTPSGGVISVGNNAYGHPTPEALGRLDAACVQVARTDNHGDVTVTTDGSSWTITSEASGVLTSGEIDQGATDCAPAQPSPPPPPPAEGGAHISATMFDPPGADSGENLVNEWVEITNGGAVAVSLTGWTLRDEADTVYTFPSFSLAPGAAVKVRTGHGIDSASDLYWGRGSPVWNNTGDTTFLRDGTGTLIDSEVG